MSGTPDLGQIKPPDPPPPARADEKTAAEKREFKQKPPTAVERESASHHAHLESWKDRVHYHCEQYDKTKLELVSVRVDLDGAKEREKTLAIRCEQLESSTNFAGLVSLLGMTMTLVGPCLMGYASLEPGVTDQEKVGYGWAGWAVLGCGIIVLGFVQLAALIIRWPKQGRKWAFNPLRILPTNRTRPALKSDRLAHKAEIVGGFAGKAAKPSLLPFFQPPEAKRAKPHGGRYPQKRASTPQPRQSPADVRVCSRRR